MYYTVTEYLHTQFKPIRLQSDAIFPLLVPEIGFIFVSIVNFSHEKGGTKIVKIDIRGHKSDATIRPDLRSVKS